MGIYTHTHTHLPEAIQIKGTAHGVFHICDILGMSLHVWLSDKVNNAINTWCKCNKGEVQ